MKVSRKWLVLWSLWAARLVWQPTVPILVSNGWLKGSIAPAGTHKEYLGIPYATVKQRFQAPGPEPNWQGVFDAVNENGRCRQLIIQGIFRTVGQDDCLILNVYTPLDDNTSNPLPVMVFIHGGAFFEGSPAPALFGPEYLVTKGVILVTISYRLSVPGFLCLHIKEAPGNAGMKDQVAALKWVRRNIGAFGGDSDNIVIFGQSAGAASVSYHLLSPMSKGLFHKAILQSGSSLSGWAHQFRPVYMASLLARTMGYNTQNPYQLYKFLSKKSNKELIITEVPREKGMLWLAEALYTPCVEKSIDGVQPFLTETPYVLFSNGNFTKVPMISGANNLEALFFTALENATSLAEITINRSLARNLLFPTEEEREYVASKLNQIYFGNEKRSRDWILNLYKYSGDMDFNYPFLEETSIVAEVSNKSLLYSYLFSYDGRRNILKKIMSLFVPNAPGASHADELFYMFSSKLVPSLFETKAIDRMTTLWTNFAKYGDPTPSVSELLPVRWPQVDNTAPSILNISSELTVVPMWYSDSLKYWREVYSKYRRLE